MKHNQFSKHNFSKKNSVSLLSNSFAQPEVSKIIKKVLKREKKLSSLKSMVATLDQLK